MYVCADAGTVTATVVSAGRVVGRNDQLPAMNVIVPVSAAIGSGWLFASLWFGSASVSEPTSL
jgi:hypothetical protein